LRFRILAWAFVPTAIILFAVALVIFLAYQNVVEEQVIGTNRENIRLSANQLAVGEGHHRIAGYRQHPGRVPRAFG
jgi:hypothetical protein